MRNERDLGYKAEDIEERGVSWRARRIGIQFVHKGTGLGGKRKDRKGGCKRWKDCGSGRRKIGEFPCDGSSFLLEVSGIDIP